MFVLAVHITPYYTDSSWALEVDLVTQTYDMVSLLALLTCLGT
jgi:hypothetical protein